VSTWKLILIVPLVLPLLVRSDSRDFGPLTILAEADRLAMLYNWPEAAPLYAQAESLFAQSGDKTNALSARLGYLWATADAGVSPANSREVATYLGDPLVQEDAKLRMRALVAKAVLDRNTNEIAARGPWEQILELAKRLGDKRWEGRAKAEIGQILYMDGNVSSAAAMLRDAIVSQYLRVDMGAAIHYTAMVGNGFVEAGQPEAGLQYCNVALRATYVAPDSGFPFLAYQGKARALMALHRDAEAAGVLKEALERASADRNFMALSQLLIVAGTASASSDPDKAIHYLKEANEISQKNGFQHVFAWSAIQLAEIYRDTGYLETAEVLASRAIDVMRNLEDRYHLPQHLALLAGLEARKGNFERADQLYSEATDVIDALLVNVTRRQLKSSLIATLSDAYVGHFELAATKFSSPAKAFEIIEEARGRAFADTLRGDSESLSASSDEISIEAEREINRVQGALMHETNREGRQTLLDQLFVQEQLLSPVRKTRSPLSSAADRGKPVPLGTLQRSLRPDEMLLEYVLGESESYCLKITRTGAAVLVLPKGRKHIEGLVDDYLAAVRSRRPEAAAGNELFSVLLETAIAQEPAKTRLIVVPDGKLHLLPFDAMTNSQGKYVLETHVVTYAPSATALHLLRLNPSRQMAMSFLGVGGVIYSRSAAAPGKTSGSPADFFDVNGVTFPDLPGSKQEVMSVAKIMNGRTQVLLDGNATEAAFKALPLADFGIIHLAVHGVANTGYPDRAALVLGSSPGSQDDGLLQVREIRDLPIRADLVTLSACETGNGRLLGEEGIATLERAFLLAGAKSVIASLWTADDTYTIALMKRLYQHLIDGYDKGTALQQAKVDRPSRPSLLGWLYISRRRRQPRWQMVAKMCAARIRTIHSERVYQ
jgi:tetratricopeptide (TPR) repeat protein